MTLTGWGLPTTLGIVAAILFVLVLAGRPRFRRRSATLGVRAVIVILLNAAVLGLVGCYLNSEYGFYANWDDLLSSGEPPVESTHHGASDPATVFASHALVSRLPSGPSRGTYPPLPQPGQRLQKYTITGARSHFHNEVWVRLPKGYDPKQRYPVILALHGMPGSPRSFTHLGRFFADLDRAADTGVMAKSIVVMPEINHPASLDAECVDIPGGPQGETWLASDVPQWTAQHFAVRSDRASWATWGYSYGGWCATALTVRHPETFGGAVVFQGYLAPRFEKPYVPLKPGTSQYEKYRLLATVRKNPPPVAVWTFASAQDSMSYPDARSLSQAARAPMSVTMATCRRGGHRIDVWASKIPMTFAWLGKTLPGFAPSHPGSRSA